MSKIPEFHNTITIPDRLKHWADLYPDKEAFVFYSDAGRRAVTCKDVFVLSMKFAALLQRRGLKQGDVICNTLTNSPERIVTDFGIMIAGCIAANAQALLKDGSDLLHVINQSRCRLLVVDNTLPGGVWDILKEHLGVVVDLNVKSEKAPKVEMVHFVGVASNTQFLEELVKEADPIPVKISPADTALYWSTSGTTGFSKLVVQSHRKLILMASNYRKLFQMDHTNIAYSDRPLGWAGGWPYGFIDMALTQVLTDTRGTASPDQYKLTWNAITAEKCTIATFTMAFLKTLSERKDILEQEGTTLLNMVISTGHPFRKHCYDVIGIVTNIVASAYGLTEAGYTTSCFCRKKEDFEDNLIGRSSNMLEIKVADEDFHEVEAGENGQILVRGCLLFDGYANNPEATKHSFTEDGWFKSNDMGYYDKKGDFFVEGRQSDAIMHGEYIIYPSWVEKKLRTCPHIAEVMVIGIPDEKLHHKICACVIPKPGINVTCDLLKEYGDLMFTDNTLLEMSAKPEHYILVQSYPTRPTGKPDRTALADLAIKLVISQGKR